MSGSTDVAYRAWGLAISTALATVGDADGVGLQKLALAGTVDWANAVKPASAAAGGAAGSEAHWEIWEFTDNLQSSSTGCPLYVRIGYNVHSGLNTVFVITVTVGTIVTGSAPNYSVAGVNGGSPQFVGTATADAIGRQWLFSSDGSGLVIMAGVNATDSRNRGLLIIDRCRNANGTPNVAGWTRVIANASANPQNVQTFNIVNYDSLMAGSRQNGSTYVMPSTVRYPAVTKTTLDGSSVLTKNVLNEAVLCPLWIANNQGTFNSRMVVTYNNMDMVSATTQYMDLNSYLGGGRYRPVTNQLQGFDHHLSPGASPAIFWVGAV